MANPRFLSVSDRAPDKGALIRLPTSRNNHGIVVTGIGKRFYLRGDDADGFHSSEFWDQYCCYVYYRDATPDELILLQDYELALMGWRERQKRIAQWFADLIERIKTEGEFPKPAVSDSMSWPKSLEVFIEATTQSRLYGGGVELFTDQYGWLWYVQGNGGDGDNWAWNNLRGAMGWQLKPDENLLDECREAARVRDEPRPTRPTIENA